MTISRYQTLNITHLA